MKGQSNVLALWSLFIMVLGILLIGVASHEFFNTYNNGFNDTMLNFLMQYLWFFVIVAGVLGFFTYNILVRGS